MRKGLFSGYPSGVSEKSVRSRADRKFTRTKDTLKYVWTLIAFLATFSPGFAQTVLINPATDGGFEQGSTIAASGWTAVNASTDQWVVGAAAGVGAGTNAAYVSANGGTGWTYSQTSTILHLYKDITIPAGENVITLAFKWKVGGEGTTTSDWDNLKVFIAPTTVNPTQGTAISSTYQVSGPGAVNGMYKLNNTSYNSESIVASVNAGTTYRLIFSWKSDVSTIANPPAAVDEISVTSRAPGNFISVVTGNWTAPSTWDANAVPTAADYVTVSTGHTVTINNASQTISKATVNGTLTFASAPTAFTVTGDLLVNTGGLIEVFNGTTGKTLNVGGNLTNNGTIDLSKDPSTLNLNGSAAQTAGGTGTFTLGYIRNLTFNNSNAVPTINWNFNNVNVYNALTFTKGWVNLGSNTLILGIDGTTTGSLSYTAGGFTSGTFGRWVSATQTGSSISAGSNPTTATSRFPFITGTGVARSIWIERVSPSAAGIQAFTYVDGTGTTTLTGVTDGTYTIDKRYNGSWTFSTLGTTPAAASYKIALVAANAYLALNGNSRIMLASAPAGGTHQNGTTTPGAQRTGLTMADLTAGPLYIGIGFPDEQFTSVASGDWNSPATWSRGAVPTCTDAVIILSGHTVTVNSAANVSKGVNINTGATLVVASGDLTVGCTLNNNTLALNGTLTVTGGTLNVNGNINMASGGTFNQSGGDINVDGNDAGITANSVANGTRHINLNASALTSVNWTGGRLTIVDPHASATATDVLYVSTGVGTLNVTAGHTLRFGNGVSTDAGGNAAGFRVNTWVVDGGMVFGNVVVEGPAGTNRLVTGYYQQPIGGNLTVNNGGEFAIGTTFVNGDVTVNTGGTITSTTSFYMNNAVFSPTAISLVFSASPNAQQITNNGTIRNATTSPTANFTALAINNSNTAGVTLNSPITVSGEIALTAGKVNTTSTNFLRLGTATAGGTMTGGSATAYIDGPFLRTFAANRVATGTYTAATFFPVGKGTSYLPVYIDPTTGSGPVIMSGEAFTTNSGTMPNGVTTLSSNRWEALVVSGATFTNAYLRLLDGTSMVSSNKILQATSAAGAYGAITPVSNFVAGTPNTLTTGSPILAANYSGYFAYGDLTPCAIPAAQPTAFVSANVGSTVFDGSFTAATGIDNYLVVRYPSGATPTSPSDFTVYAVGATLGTTPNQGTVVSNSASTAFAQTGLTAATTYDYYIYSFNNTACFGPIYNVTSPLTGTVTTCATAVGTPGTPVSSVVTTTGFTATWTASSTAGVTYTIDVATNNTFTNIVAGYNGLNVGSVLTTPISGLSPNTTYYVRVRAIDGACSSAASATLTQTTDCNAISSFPWVENFNNVVVPALPACFYQNNANNDADFWRTFDGFGINGSISAGLYTDGNSGANNDYLILPQFNLSGSKRLRFSVRARSASEPNDYRVVLSTSGRAAADFTTVLQPLTTVSNTTYAEIAPINLSAYSGNVWIAIHVPAGGLDGWYLYVDSMVVEDIPAPVITAFTPASSCGASATVTITGTELANATLAVGATPLTIVSNTTTQIVATAPSGVNGPIVLTNAGGTFTTSTNLSVLAPPAFTISASSATICSGQSQTVNVTAGASDYDTYTWTPSTGVTGTASTGFTFTPTATTNYVLAASQSAGNLCAVSASVNVTVNQTPVAVVTPTSAELCEGEVVMLTGSSMLAGAGTLGTGTTSTAASGTGDVLGPNPMQTYYGGTKQQMLFTAAELTGMGMIAGAKINQLQLQMNAVDNTYALQNFKIKMQNTTAAALTTTMTTTGWTTVRPAASHTPVAGYNTWALTTPFEWDGTSNLLVELTYSNNNGGATTSANTAYYGTTPFVSTAFYRVDNNSAATIENATTANFTYSARNNTKFAYNNPVGLVWSAVTNLYSNAAATTPYSGSSANTVYLKGVASETITGSITTPEGCTATATIPVTVHALPTVSAGADDEICAGEQVTLTATGSALTPTWTNSVSNGVAFTPAATATYTVSVEDANGCVGTDAVTITVNALPMPTITADGALTLCAGEDVTLTSSATSGNVWSTNATTNAITVTTSGSYTVTQTDANGCVGTSAPTVVVVNALPAVNAGADISVCQNSTAILLATGAQSYQWTGNIQNGVSFIATQTATYTVTGTDANGCTNTDQVVVTVNPLPNVDAGANQTLCGAGQITLTATGATVYSWNNNVVNGTPFTVPVGTNVYLVTGIDANGCSNTDAVTVTVNPVPVATATAANQLTIVAAPAGMSYQWINCATNQPILGANNQTFTATANGSYKVIVTGMGGCADTSACVNINSVGLGENTIDLGIGLYPNPTGGDVYVSMAAADQADIKVFDAQGKLVSTMEHVKDGAVINLNGVETGMYMIHVSNENGSNIFRIVKK